MLLLRHRWWEQLLPILQPVEYSRRYGLWFFTHKWNLISPAVIWPGGPHRPFSSQPSFCSCRSGANLWRKASSPAGVHLFDLHRLSGFSVPTDPRQYEAGAASPPLAARVTTTTQGKSGHESAACVSGWNQVKGRHTPFCSQGHTQTSLSKRSKKLVL